MNEHIEKKQPRPLSDLVKDGTVLDFSNEAKNHLFDGRIFVQTTLWDAWNRSEAKLRDALDGSAGMFNGVLDRERFGMRDYGKNDFAYIVEPNDELKCIVIVIFESGGEEALGMMRFTQGESFEFIQ